MPEPIKPIAEIPIPLNDDGSVGGPALHFAPDSSVLYVRQPIRPFDLGEFIQWHAPDVAGVSLVIAILIIVITLRRVLLTPRERGKLYCRACNYQITPPLALRKNARTIVVGEGARCPECGTELAKRKPVVGGRRFFRLWPAWAVAGPVLLPCLLAMVLTLQWYSPPRGTPWPFRGVERLLGGRAVQKVPRDGWRPTTDHITRWKLPEGRRIEGEWLAETLGFNNAMLTPDGSKFVFVVDEYHRWMPRLLIIDTRTGEKREAEIPVKPGSGTELLGLSADGTRAFVQCPNNVGSIEDGFKGCCLRLMEVRIDSLEFKELASIPIRPDKVGASYQWPYTGFLVDDSMGTPRWLYHVYRVDSAGAPVSCEVTWFDGEKRVVYTPTMPTGRGWPALQLRKNATEVEIVNGGTKTSTFLDLATGATTSGPTLTQGNWGQSVNGRYILDNSAKTPGALHVVEAATGRTIALITSPTGTLPGGGTISNDGRFVASGYFTSTTPPYKYFIGVWDLGDAARRAPAAQTGEPDTTP